MTLEARIKRQLKAHVEKRNGVITAPDMLIDRILQEVEQWLSEQRQGYRISNSFVRMETLDEIQAEVREEIKEGNENEE